MDKLRIGLIASNWRPIPGGVRNIYAPGVIILALADRLVEQGHDVTLFAPKDTKTKAKLVHEGLLSPWDEYHKLLREDLSLYVMLERGYELMLISKAFEMAQAGHFDVLHAHKISIEPFFANLVETPLVVTQHHSYKETVRGITTAADQQKLVKYKKSIYYTGISKFMTSEVDLNYAGVVYNGIDEQQFNYKPETKRQNMLFMGRIAESKGPDLAIEIAQKLNVPLDLVGDRRYGQANEAFWDKIEPSLKQPNMHYHGFVPVAKTPAFYQQSKVTLFPIREPEPFGLVMTESMACGTPVVAFNLGSTVEIIDHGKTGFLIKPGDTSGMIEAVKAIYAMPEAEYRKMQQACRDKVEQLFTYEKMTAGYLDVYRRVIADRKAHPRSN